MNEQETDGRKQEQETRTKNSKQGYIQNQVDREIVRRTHKDWVHSVDYKYTGEWMLYAGILGREEELNNYGRWITREGDSMIMRVTRYADKITHIA